MGSFWGLKSFAFLLLLLLLVFFFLVLFLQNMLVSFLLSAVILCESEASGEFAPTGAGARLPTTSLLHVDEEEEDGGNFSARRVVEPTAGSY